MDAARGEGPREQLQQVSTSESSEAGAGAGAGGPVEVGRGSTGLASLQDAPAVPPSEQLPAVPLLDGLLYRDEVRR